MRTRLLTFAACLILISRAVGQDTWTTLANPPAGFVARQGGVAFQIGGIGYIGTGQNTAHAYLKDFWKYDPTTGAWTQLQDASGVARYLAIGFAIGSKGYIGTGNIANNQQLVGANDFYEYDPATNIWVIRQSVGLFGRISASAFSVGGKGYVTCGFNSNFNYDPSTWEFDPITNLWTQKQSFAGHTRDGAASFVIGSDGYIVGGQFVDNVLGYPVFYKDTWSYTPSSDSWVQKAFMVNSYLAMSGFSIGTKGYIFGQKYGGTSPANFWMFDPSANTWTAKVNYPGYGVYASVFADCNQAFVFGDGFSASARKFTLGLTVAGPQLVCTTGNYSVTDLPAGSTVVWSSSNPSGFSINSSGVATRLNGFTGSVTITATICGRSTFNKTVSVGSLSISGPTINGSCLEPTYVYTVPNIPGVTYTWTINNTHLSVSSGSSTANVDEIDALVGSNPFTLTLTATQGSCSLVSTRGGNYVKKTPQQCGMNFLVATSPNPASSEIKLTFTDEEFISRDQLRNLGVVIYKPSGAVVQNTCVSETSTIDISNLENGLYFLQVRDGDRVETRRIVVAH